MPIVKPDPGQKHIHFYDSFNLQIGQEVFGRSTVMNTQTASWFLYKRAAAFHEQGILFLWKCAPWHLDPEIDATLEAHPDPETLYLSTVAPELNPQKHVCKSARVTVSHNHSQHCPRATIENLSTRKITYSPIWLTHILSDNNGTPLGKTLDPYEIIEKIGQVGMAHVFKAHQLALNRLVAVKVLSLMLAVQEPGFTERFHCEAYAIVRLNHPNILLS